MKLEHAFEVPASREQTLALLLDAKRVVPCMPGAELLEEVDETHWRSRLSIKLGPVGMQFNADVTMLAKDDAAGTVKLGISGRDTRGKGGAEGTVDSTLLPIEGGSGTRVEMLTDLRFSGQAAQLGRPSVVKDVSNKLVDQFARCIGAQLQAQDEPDRPEAAQAAQAAIQQARKPVSGFSLMVGAVISAIKRLLGRSAGSGRSSG